MFIPGQQNAGQKKTRRCLITSISLKLWPSSYICWRYNPIGMDTWRNQEQFKFGECLVLFDPEFLVVSFVVRACGYSVVTYAKFADVPVDILWLHIRSLQTCLWIFCGYIYEVCRHVCGYSVVTYTKFADIHVDILWLHIRSLQTCLWVFCDYIYEL
jgi:hypothetical protein